MFPRVKKIINWFLCRCPKLYRAIISIYPNEGRNQRSVYLRFVKKGDHVIDIGANIGNITLLLSNIVGKKGKVFSYEAVKPTYEKLLQNITTNAFYNNIAAFNLAVGNESKEVLIMVPGDDYGQASMQTHQKGSWTSAADFTTFASSCIMLDNEVSKFEKLDFIKIDIEGAELPAIKGAEQLVKKFKPVLYIEVYKEWTKEFNYHPLDLYQYIKSLGYKKFNIVTHKGITDLKNPEEQLNEDYSADLVCIF